MYVPFQLVVFFRWQFVTGNVKQDSCTVLRLESDQCKPQQGSSLEVEREIISIGSIPQLWCRSRRGKALELSSIFLRFFLRRNTVFLVCSR